MNTFVYYVFCVLDGRIILCDRIGQLEQIFLQMKPNYFDHFWAFLNTTKKPSVTTLDKIGLLFTRHLVTL